MNGYVAIQQRLLDGDSYLGNTHGESSYLIQMHNFFLAILYIQSNLSNVTLQGNIEIWSHKTGGCLIQV